MKALQFTLIYSVPLMLAVGLYFGGWVVWLTPLVVFAVIPTVDQWLTRDTGPTQGQPWLHKLVVRCWIVAHGGVVAAATAVVATRPMTAWELVSHENFQLTPAHSGPSPMANRGGLRHGSLMHSGP